MNSLLKKHLFLTLIIFMIYPSLLHAVYVPVSNHSSAQKRKRAGYGASTWLVGADAFAKCGSESYSDGRHFDTYPSNEGCVNATYTTGWGPEKKDLKVNVVKYRDMIPKGAEYIGIQIIYVYSSDGGRKPLVYVFYMMK